MIGGMHVDGLLQVPQKAGYIKDQGDLPGSQNGGAANPVQVLEQPAERLDHGLQLAVQVAVQLAHARLQVPQ